MGKKKHTPKLRTSLTCKTFRSVFHAQRAARRRWRCARGSHGHLLRDRGVAHQTRFERWDLRGFKNGGDDGPKCIYIYIHPHM